MKKKKIFKVVATGWEMHKPDHRNASWNKIFGAVAAAPPDTFSRPVPDYVPYQGQILSCVACTAAKDQEYGSSLEGKNIRLSFREPYAATPGGNGGRNYVDVVKRVRDVGMPEESFCPNDVAVGFNQFLNVAQFRTPEMYANAQIYRLKGYSFINTELASLRTACFRKPIWIAIPGNNADWEKPVDEIVTYSGKEDWRHSIYMWDWHSNLYNGVLNWWGDRYRKLSTSYPVLAALSTEDLPDNWQQLQNSMEYIILNGKEQFLIYPNLKIGFNIGDETELQKLRELGLAGDPIPMVSLDGYTIYPMVQKDRLRDLFGL